MTDSVTAEVEGAIVEYLNARKRLLEVAERHPELLKGNDNIVGTRIGEYIAMTWLRQRGRSPVKVDTPSQEGFDLLDGDTKVSVKLLTEENTTDRTTRLTDPWDELLVIDFSTRALRCRVGHLLRSRFDKALTDHPAWSRHPYVKRSMLGGKGLIGIYGDVTDYRPFPSAKSD
jgi:hypothetical protein